MCRVILNVQFFVVMIYRAIPQNLYYEQRGQSGQLGNSQALGGLRTGAAGGARSIY